MADFPTITLRRWVDIRIYVKKGWLFRGHRSLDWELESSLERCCNREDIKPNKRGMFEGALIREFQRSYHLYTHTPPEGAMVEWLSLMQHHGAPTRLLDFTYSMYVALYFALECAMDGTNAAVIAVNADWALNRSYEKLKKARKAGAKKMKEPFFDGDEARVKGLFLDEPYVAAAWPINPFRLNERLRIQQGIFLVPGDISKSFTENIEALEGYDHSDSPVIKIIIPAAERRDALRGLFQMGISRTNLFPGLDGFAHSLNVFHPVAYDRYEKVARSRKSGARHKNKSY